MRIALPSSLQDVSHLARLFEIPVADSAKHDKITGIATHSAEVQKGDLFVCLKGNHANGAIYANEAIANGAHALLGPQHSFLETNKTVLYCENVEDALLRAASAYRAEIGAEVIAITGSAGKTTVKEAVSAVLGDVPHSKGNFNSCIGMPLSVLSLPSATRWVLEVGISHAGEMRKMARAMDEKGVLLLPSELPMALFTPPSCHILRVGAGHGADILIKDVHSNARGVRATLVSPQREIKELFWPIPGSIGVSVIGQAASVGMLCGRSDEEIREGLCRAGERTPRMQRTKVGDILIINDCYNASPEAMIASLEVLKHVAGRRPAVAVLGDMLELGSYAPPLHDAVGVFVARLGIHLLYTYGEEASMIASGAARRGMSQANIRHYRAKERDLLVKELIQRLPRDAVVLFKASHGMHLEDVVTGVKEGL